MFLSRILSVSSQHIMCFFFSLCSLKHILLCLYLFTCFIFEKFRIIPIQIYIHIQYIFKCILFWNFGEVHADKQHNSRFVLTKKWPGKNKESETIEDYCHNTNLTLTGQVMKVFISKPIFTICQNKISKAFFIVSPASEKEHKLLIWVTKEVCLNIYFIIQS